MKENPELNFSEIKEKFYEFFSFHLEAILQLAEHFEQEEMKDSILSIIHLLKSIGKAQNNIKALTYS